MKIELPNGDHIENSLIISLWESCYKWIKTHFITVFIGIALVIVFLFFENEIVEALFSFIGKISESILGIVLLCILGVAFLFIMVYNATKTIKGNTLSEGRTYFFSLILCIIFAHCVIKYPWGKESPIDGYGWIFLVLFILYFLYSLVFPIIAFFRITRKSNNYKVLSSYNQNKDYLSDNAITSKDKDELRFNEHVESLKKRIDETSIRGTHSIAIIGGWGSGKTSFLNLLHEKMDSEKKYEVIWFNPLKSSKPDNIQNDFFNLLEETLSKYKKGFGRHIKYYKELIGAIDNKYVSFLVKLGSIQLESEKKRVNDIIKKIPKRIIIIIDDVDRLNRDEIINIFRLVGFNAAFDNVVFLTAMDKLNVIKTLNCDESFPDKFFEREFLLPDNARRFTTQFVMKTLKEELSPEITKDILDDITIPEYIAYCIDNLRDAKRFLNNFIDRVSMIQNKLDVRSYFLLSLIQYKSLSLYEQLKKKDLLELDNDCLMLKEDKCSKIDITLSNMLHRLFPNNGNPNPRYINHPDYFYDYFNESSAKSVIDSEMIDILVSESEKELTKALESYKNDRISEQNIVDFWKNHNIRDDSFSQLILRCNTSLKNKFRLSPEQILAKLNTPEFLENLYINYYRICGYLKIDNGLNFSEDLAPVLIGWSKYAYIKKDGSIAFLVDYNYAYGFSDGRARVGKNGKWGFIDTKGNLIIHLEYDTAESFSGGLAHVSKDEKHGFIDKDNNPTIPLEYDNAFTTKNIIWLNKDNKLGFWDKGNFKPL